jgi:photosystem II stability/assembly factor-like uncharacterized protein
MRFRPVLIALLCAVLPLSVGLALSSGSNGASSKAAGLRVNKFAENELAADKLTAPADIAFLRAFGMKGAPVDTGQFFAQAASAAQDLPEIGGDWNLVGPTNIGGRVLDVVVDPRTDPEHKGDIYIAAATGGVWTSTDGGKKFSSVWPDDLTQTIGALAIAPDGTLYAGTGEAGPGGGSSTYGGTGVYKSTDSGKHWDYIGLADTNRIGRIVVDQKNPNRIYVAGTGPLYTKGGGRGLYVSDDAGETWRRVLTGDNDTTGAVDVAIDPRDSKVVYAAMWDNYRERDRRLYEGLGSGLYKSTDGGVHWARIGTPFFGPTPETGRIGVAVAPDGTVYGNVAGPSGVYRGFFSSTDGGQTWSTGTPPVNPQNSYYVYGWWFGRIYVDPKDSKHVYQASLVLQESKNGGQSWADAPGGCSNICNAGHADQHAMAWDPNTPGRVYLGNDGGVFRTDNNGAAWTGKFTYLPISQINGMDISQQDPTRIVVGLQDNGQNRNWVKTTDGGSTTTYNSYGGGDGQRVNIAPTRKNVVYGCSQYGVCDVSTDGGASSSALGTSSPETGACPGTRSNWFTPIEFNPSDDSTVYSGSEAVCMITGDGSGLPQPISPDLSNGPGRETNPLFKNYGTVQTIAVGKDGKTLYAGTDDGNLWYTHDSSSPAGWTKASSPALPKAWITRLEVDPKNDDIAYVTYSGYRMGDNVPYILKTTDGGVTWTDISANLPKAPLNDVNVIGDALVVASDVGVFARRAGETKWARFGKNLPLAPAYELRYATKTDELFVGTFGRGVYKTDAKALKK